jgi:hypothetical protein
MHRQMERKKVYKNRKLSDLMSFLIFFKIEKIRLKISKDRKRYERRRKK